MANLNQNSQGYIWVPYIMDQSVSTISESYFTGKKIKSRYSTVSVSSKFYGYFMLKKIKRKNKIQKIFKLKSL